MNQYLDESKWISHLDEPMYLFSCGRKSLIYKLLDENDTIIYIGKTNNGGRRISYHDRHTRNETDIDKAFDFSNVHVIEVSKENQRDIEKYLIQYYKPKYNKQYIKRGSN